MNIYKSIDGKQYELIPSSDLHRIKEIVVYINKIEKFKKCVKGCSALQTLKKMVGGL